MTYILVILLLALQLLLSSWINNSHYLVHAFHPSSASTSTSTNSGYSNNKNAKNPIHNSVIVNSRYNCGGRVVFRTTDSTTTTSLFVFERMSEECISAIVTAQKQTNLYQLEYVDRQAMMLGIIDQKVETKALDRTVQQYKLSWRLAERTFKEIHTTKDTDNSGSSDTNNNSNAAGWLSGFRAAKQANGDKDRPFSKELKQSLLDAGKIANQMGSVTVGTHHVFLALLEYKDAGKDGVPTAVDSVYDVDTNSPWYLLKKMDAFDEHITPLNVCKTLLTNLKNMEDDDGGKGELVTSGSSSSSSKTPTLNEYGTDLTQMAADGLLDPVYGRTNEIRSVIRTLIRRRKNNVCLIGEPGVGKTAIAEGVAQILVDEDGKCPVPLQGYRLISLELSSLVAGTKYRGDFEERLQAIIQEVTNPKAIPTILFIDEIHNLIGAGSASGGESGGTMDAANILKPALARGTLQLIGATTIAEYRKYIEKDAALERRLQPIMVKEPSIEQTIEILQAVRSNYEKHHNVRYTPLALQAAAQLSERYISDRFLPDKALDLLDESGAITQLEYLEERSSDSSSSNSNSRTMDDPNDDDAVEKYVPVVTEHTIAAVMSEWSGIPIGKLESDELDRLRYLENEMSSRVKGQDRAIRGVARAIRRARSGLRDPKRPVASFMFCGPTGTGKTELCKTLAETYYGSEKDMIRIDMSEYMDKHTTSRLTGPPPGYIGYEAGGQLTEAVRRRPHAVVLFDEIEKAHEDVLNILLQMMEDGILTDGKGRTVNFKNTVIVMTSNVGSRRILDVCRNYSVTKNGTASVITRTDRDSSTKQAIRVGSTQTPTISSIPTNESTRTSSNNGIRHSSNNGISHDQIAVVVDSIDSVAPQVPATTGSSIEPMNPEDVLKKMQQNPKAAGVLLKAATDPDIMNAVRIAMNGSPADLLKEAQRNPTIASFLQNVYSALQETEEETQQAQSPEDVVVNTSIPMKSGLDSIRNSFQESISQQVEDPQQENRINKEISVLYTSSSATDMGVEHELYPELISVVKEELEAAMKPEFLNRIDEIVVFSPLSKNNLEMIAALAIQKIVRRAAQEHSMEELIVQPCLIERVTEEGSANANTFGARPMRRAAQRYIEDSLSDAIISGFFNLPNGGKETKASLSLVQTLGGGGKDKVAIQRMSDGLVLEVTIEDASGGMGGMVQQDTINDNTTEEKTQNPLNGEQRIPVLQTEPSQK